MSAGSDRPVQPDSPSITDDRVERMQDRMATRRNFLRMSAAVGATAAATTIGVTPAFAQAALNYDSDLVPNPRIEADVTIAEHDRETMDSALEYIDDNGDLTSLGQDGGRVLERPEEDEPHNPITLEAHKFDTAEYTRFPRDETREVDDDEEEDVSALDAEEWDVDESGTAGTMTVEDDGDALEISTSGQSADDTAVATFSTFEITSGENRKYIQSVINVETVDADTEVMVRAVDAAGNHKETEVAEATGDGQVTQVQLGDLDSSGSDFDDIEEVEIRVSDGDVSMTVVGLNLERESRWEFGTQEYLDEDDEIDTQTVREPSGEFSIRSIGTIGDEFSDALINDLQIETQFEAGRMENGDIDYRITDADRYSYDQRLEKVVNFELPTAFDLSYADTELMDTVLHPGDRHLQVAYDTGLEDPVDLEDIDDEDPDVDAWTDRTDDYTRMDNVIELTTTINVDQVQAVFYDILVSEDEVEAMEDTTVGAGPTDTRSDGMLGWLFSVPGMIVSAVVGWFGARRLGLIPGVGGE